jgi:hypothetical protein
MNIQSLLPEKVNRLPVHAQHEVLEYVNFLLSKYNTKKEYSPAVQEDVPHITSLRGTLRDVDISDIRDEADRVL